MALDKDTIGRYHIPWLKIHDVSHEDIGDGDFLGLSRANNLHVSILPFLVEFDKLSFFSVIVDRSYNDDNNNSYYNCNSLDQLYGWISRSMYRTEGLVQSDTQR